MSQHIDIGDSVEFYCSRCRLNLNGTVTAINADGSVLQVTCRTCQSQQPFKPMVSKELLAARKLRRALAIRDKRTQAIVDQQASRTAQRLSGDAITQRWRAATENADSRFAKRYSVGSIYQEGDVLLHTDHGLGIVEKVLHETAILALFRKAEVPLQMNSPSDYPEDNG